MLNVIRADDSITYVSLSGRLDVEGVSLVQDQFTFNTTSRRKPTLVDVSEVTFIASMGIGMLVGAAKALQRSGTKMVIVGPRDFVQHVLDSAGIGHVIPIVRAEADALQLLR